MKTDKELTVEIVVAAINANPRMVHGNNQQLSASLDTKSIVHLMQTVHQTLHQLDDASKETK